MKHEILHFDVVENRIYQSASISYVIRNDPEDKIIRVLGMAVFHLVPMGEEEAGMMQRFDVYLDPTPIGARIKEVAALNEGKDS